MIAAKMEQCFAGDVQNRLRGDSTVYHVPPVSVPLPGGAKGQVPDPFVGRAVSVPDEWGGRHSGRDVPLYLARRWSSPAPHWGAPLSCCWQSRSVLILLPCVAATVTVNNTVTVIDLV